MAVGDGGYENKKSEIYSFASNARTDVADYPYGDGSISQFVMLYLEDMDAYLVIGGTSGGIPARRRRNTDIDAVGEITKFQNGEWSKIGKLNHPRSVSFDLISRILNL